MKQRKLVFVFATVSVLALAGCASGSKPSAQASAPPAVSGPPAPTAAAPAKPEVKADSVSCQRDADKRSIEIESADKASCKLWYSKDGKRTSVASSAKGVSHCTDVRNRMKTNLETAGFKCQ